MVNSNKTIEDVEFNALAKSYQRVKYVTPLHTLYWIASYLVSLHYFFEASIVWSLDSCQPSMIIPIPLSLGAYCLQVTTPLLNPLEVAWFFLLRSYTWILLLPTTPLLTGYRTYQTEGGSKPLRPWIHKIKNRASK